MAPGSGPTSNEEVLRGQLVAAQRRDKKEGFRQLKNHLLRPENRALLTALRMLQDGPRFYINRSGALQAAAKDGEGSSRTGRMVADYILRHGVVILFSDNLYGQEYGRVDWGDHQIHPRSKYQYRQFSTIWLSPDIRKNPLSMAMVIAHEYGHLLLDEYRMNCPDEKKQPAWLKKALADPEEFCNALGGAVGSEMHLDGLQKLYPWRLSPEELAFYEHIVGGRSLADVEAQIHMNYMIGLYEGGWASRGHRCGMRCKYFEHYGLCDNRVKFPPCHLYSKHLERLLADDAPIDEVPSPSPKEGH